MMRSDQSHENDDIPCPICGKPAQIRGRCAVARIPCRYCGSDVLASAYKDAIEAYKQGLCSGEDTDPGTP